MLLKWLQTLIAPTPPTTLRELTTLEHWQEAREASRERPLFLFKHSTACPISARALQRVEAYKAENPGAPEFLIVKVIESRPISNAIAQDLGVEHRSPQLILLKDGACASMHSHHGINAENITQALT